MKIKRFFFVGNGSIVFKDVIQSTLNNKSLFANDIYKNDLNAVSVANVAIDKFYSNKLNYYDINPLYLKKSSAELSLEDTNI